APDLDRLFRANGSRGSVSQHALLVDQAVRQIYPVRLTVQYRACRSFSNYRTHIKGLAIQMARLLIHRRPGHDRQRQTRCTRSGLTPLWRLFYNWPWRPIDDPVRADLDERAARTNPNFFGSVENNFAIRTSDRKVFQRTQHHLVPLSLDLHRPL